MFIFLDFSLNTSRAIKKEGVKISKTEYTVFVYYKQDSKYKKSSKFEEVMVHNKKKMTYFIWTVDFLARTSPSEVIAFCPSPNFATSQIRFCRTSQSSGT
jgi:hypothetical protein